MSYFRAAYKHYAPCLVFQPHQQPRYPNNLCSSSVAFVKDKFQIAPGGCDRPAEKWDLQDLREHARRMTGEPCATSLVDQGELCVDLLVSSVLFSILLNSSIPTTPFFSRTRHGEELLGSSMVLCARTLLLNNQRSFQYDESKVFLRYRVGTVSDVPLFTDISP